MSRCTACSFLLDRLEYALHLLGRELEALKRQGFTSSARVLEHEIAHLRLVVRTAKEAEIVPSPRPPLGPLFPRGEPPRLYVVDGEDGGGHDAA